MSANKKNKNKKKKAYPLNKKNIFKNRSTEDLRFTNHFFDRWNERTCGTKFESKSDMEDFIKSNFDNSKIEHISGDYYFMDDLIITAAIDESDGNIILITVYGTIEENPILYNVLITQGVNGVKKAHRLYGKININQI